MVRSNEPGVSEIPASSYTASSVSYPSMAIHPVAPMDLKPAPLPAQSIAPRRPLVHLDTACDPQRSFGGTPTPGFSSTPRTSAKQVNTTGDSLPARRRTTRQVQAVVSASDPENSRAAFASRSADLSPESAVRTGDSFSTSPARSDTVRLGVLGGREGRGTALRTRSAATRRVTVLSPPFSNAPFGPVGISTVCARYEAAVRACVADPDQISDSAHARPDRTLLRSRRRSTCTYNERSQAVSLCA